MALDMDALVEDVAARLGVSTSSAEPAVSAAVSYIVLDTGVLEDDMLATDALLNVYGIPLLALRIYQDPPTLGGETNNIDPTFSGIYTPSNLGSHLEQYWMHLRKPTQIVGGFA